MTAVTQCPAVFFDGFTAARRPVAVTLGPTSLAISAPDGTPIDEWPYPRLEHLSAPSHVFRIGLRHGERLARLEIHDPAVAHEIDLACPGIDRTGAGERAAQRQAILWSALAAISLLLVAAYGVPTLADRIAPLVPQGAETRLGVAADRQIRAMLARGPADQPLECGTGTGEAAGLAAFNKLIAQLRSASGVRIPLRAAVIRREEANAIALPGGHIYVFQGLIDQARTADEVAGVIAHELGHVQGRDGMRAMLQAAGLSLIFGVLLGDFVGGGAVVVAAESLLKSAYSRSKEAAADAFAVRTMMALNADARALGRFLNRIAGSPGRGSIFLDHPAAPERAARIDAMAPPQSGGARLLDAAEWAALKRICAGNR